MKGQREGQKQGRNRRNGSAKDYAYLEPLTKRQARKEVQATTRAQFRPLTQQIKAEKRASGKRVGEIKDWFGEYGGEVDTARASTDAKYADTLAKIAAQTGATASQDETLRQQLAKEEAADAALRGATTNPAESQAAAQAALARRSTADTNYGTVAGQGASQYAYLTDKGLIGKGEEGRQISDERARGRSINADLRDLAKERGDFRTEYKGQQRGAEREYLLQKMAFEKPSAAQRTQKQVARLQGRNTRRASAQSFAQQKALAGIHAKYDRQSDKRGFKYQQKQGKGGDGSPYSGRQLRAALESYKGPLKDKGDLKAAADALTERKSGVGWNRAYQAVRGYAKKRRPPKPGHGNVYGPPLPKRR